MSEGLSPQQTTPGELEEHIPLRKPLTIIHREMIEDALSRGVSVDALMTSGAIPELAAEAYYSNPDAEIDYASTTGDQDAT